MGDCYICYDEIPSSSEFVSCPNSHKYHTRCFFYAFNKYENEGSGFSCACAHSFLKSNEILRQMNEFHYE